MNDITLRPGTIEDSHGCFLVFEETIAHLVRRFGSSGPMSWDDPTALAAMWEQRRPLYEHLARTCEHFWVAERDGQVAGYGRSILRDGSRELTELFMRPDSQSGGAGRELISRCFPAGGAQHRCIIATADFRAQSLYLRNGVVPRFPIYFLGRQPQVLAVDTDLQIEPIAHSQETLAALRAIDQATIGFRRDEDHTWFLSQRQGYLYRRGGEPVGYGYVSLRTGPFALLDNRDFPAVLAHAETQAAALGLDNFGFEVPLVNQAAFEYLLGRGFQVNPFAATMLTDRPFGRFENYIVNAPPFFM